VEVEKIHQDYRARLVGSLRGSKEKAMAEEQLLHGVVDVGVELDREEWCLIDSLVMGDSDPMNRLELVEDKKKRMEY
jgi:hypothetical protein